MALLFCTVMRHGGGGRGKVLGMGDKSDTGAGVRFEN
jgi:hypothetical protein